MNPKDKLAILCVVVLIGSCITPPTVSPIITPTVSSPIRTPVAQTASLTFRNGDFERPYLVWGAADTDATGWRSWHDDIPPCMPGQLNCALPCPTNCTECKKKDLGCFWASPEWAEAWYGDYGGFRVRTGQSAQKMFCYGRECDPKVYQQVDVIPGTVVTFSVYMMAWQCFDNNMCTLAQLNTALLPNGLANPIYNPDRVAYLLNAWGCTSFKACASRAISDRPYKMNLRVGVDVTGIISPSASSVVWSPTGESFDVWSKFTVTDTAQASRITLWVESSPMFDYIRTNNDVYIDSGSLELYFPYKYLYLPNIRKTR